MLSIPGFITIRFIKDESKYDDDIITIRPVDSNRVSVIMTGDTVAKNSVVQAALHMTHDDCLRWFVRTTNILSTDDYPIDQVQFDFPFCPSVMYKLENLDRYMHAVYDMLAFQLSLWNSRPELNEIQRPAPIEIPPQPVLEAFDDDNVLNMAFIKEEGAAAGRHANQVKGRHHLFFDDLA
jgi:hypothetical protein